MKTPYLPLLMYETKETKTKIVNFNKSNVVLDFFLVNLLASDL